MRELVPVGCAGVAAVADEAAILFGAVHWQMFRRGHEHSLGVVYVARPTPARLASLAAVGGFRPILRETVAAVID